VWTVTRHPDADSEFKALGPRDAVAVTNAVRKLQALGPRLGYPYSSDIRGADRLRELRPRAGRSTIRVFYRQVGATFVIGAFGPEAGYDPKGFTKACRAAERRLNRMEG